MDLPLCLYEYLRHTVDEGQPGFRFKILILLACPALSLVSVPDEGRDAVTCAGEEPDVGYAQDNYLAFEAQQDLSSGSGVLVIYWPSAPGGSPGCFANPPWPILDTVMILGLPPVDTSSVSVMVSPQALLAFIHL